MPPPDTHWRESRANPGYRPCQTEIEQLYSAIAGDEDVLRFQVAMHDTFVVRGGEPTGDLERIINSFAERQRARAQPFAQRFAFQQFADDVRRAVLRADVVHGEDVGMVEGGGGTRFLLKAM